MNDKDAFGQFFEAVTSHAPHPYQTRLATTEDWPETLVIPTGFGKTAAVILAWLWRLSRDPERTPRRLIYCLPMRTLVEQTRDVAVKWVEAACSTPSWDGAARPLVEVLMGGEARPRGAPDWIMQIDRPAILIGTQDLLVSAALMRGYGATRYRWPVDFALLHTDALWVFDEVQLAGATLPTSAQLEAWRKDKELFPASAGERERPARTLWMSATLDPAWLKTVDHVPRDTLRANDLQADDLASLHAFKLWGAVKTLSPAPAGPPMKSATEEEAYAAWVAALARARLRSEGTVLIFLNTVKRAQAVYRALLKAGVAGSVLLHSRFRPPERAVATTRALERSPNHPPVIVTTQALEAGVDLTSAALITELAPWSSLVQRIGRCNRYGECGEAGAEVVWIDLTAGMEAPYGADELDAARGKLAGLTECGPKALSLIAPSRPSASPVIRKRDLLDLFDTEADLSGFDVDVSMYVREVDDVDLRLFWRVVQEGERPAGITAALPIRDELCPASIGRTRLLVKRTDVRAWRWDALSKAWVKLLAAELRPGLDVMLAADSGGYDPIMGFAIGSKAPVPPPPAKASAPVTEVDEPDSLSEDRNSETNAAVTLADHSRHVHAEAERLCKALQIEDELRVLVLEAALWHDRGKAHAVFQSAVSPSWNEGLSPLAKSGRTGRLTFQRSYFRHEVASALAWLEAKGWSRAADLGAYLIAAHHGRVRMRLRALPEEKVAPNQRLFARGVWDGDTLPAGMLADETVPAATMHLDLMQLGEGEYGPSWSARTQTLLKTHGPFRLAWLEALVRIADWRASAAEALAAKHGSDVSTPWRPDTFEDDGQ